jgi:hypothetical protein
MKKPIFARLKEILNKPIKGLKSKEETVYGAGHGSPELVPADHEASKRALGVFNKGITKEEWESRSFLTEDDSDILASNEEVEAEFKRVLKETFGDNVSL